MSTNGQNTLNLDTMTAEQCVLHLKPIIENYECRTADGFANMVIFDRLLTITKGAQKLAAQLADDVISLSDKLEISKDAFTGEQQEGVDELRKQVYDRALAALQKEG